MGTAVVVQLGTSHESTVVQSSGNTVWPVSTTLRVAFSFTNLSCSPAYIATGKSLVVKKRDLCLLADRIPTEHTTGLQNNAEGTEDFSKITELQSAAIVAPCLTMAIPTMTIPKDVLLYHGVIFVQVGVDSP